MLKKTIALAYTLLMVVFFLGCNNKKNENISMQALYSKLEETGLFPPMIPVKPEDMAGIYGIESAKISDCVFCVSEDAKLSDEAAIFKVSDPEYAGILYNMFVSRVDAKARRAEGYDAREYAKCKRTSVVRTGNYVYYIVNDGYDTLMKLMRSYIG